MVDVYSDFNATFDSQLDCAITATNSLHLESSSDSGASPIINAPGTQPRQRPFIPKRPHTKSRVGCNQCKKRKVKCDETRPSCKNCTRRNEECVYKASSPPPISLPKRYRKRFTEDEEDVETEDVVVRAPVTVIDEPLFEPEHFDAVDMKMLWFYTTHSYQHFSFNSGIRPVDHALRVKIVEHAFRSPFLMESLKALSALHLSSLGQPVPPRKIATYQAHAFQGYRTAIEAARPDDYPALLGCSLFMIALSSHNFRDPSAKKLFIVDWIAIWRGIGLIFMMISPQAVEDSGIASLFYRPPLDMARAARYIPQNLLAMIASIPETDPDYRRREDYFELLKYLGSLYMELSEHGFNHILDCRIITMFSFYPRSLIPSARKLRPRILVIIAYWLCFLKIINPTRSWWTAGIVEQAWQVFAELAPQPEWAPYLRIPQAVMQTADNLAVARLILENPIWTPVTDPQARPDLTLVTEAGDELEVADGEWRLKDSGVGFELVRQRDQDVDRLVPFTLRPDPDLYGVLKPERARA